MTHLEIDKLNRKFSLNTDQCRLEIVNGKGDIAQIQIKNQQASAVISLQGAHLLSWIPKGEEDVIWLSSDVYFEKGKSVRGGIPVCWPWFGAHESNAGYPAHGFARTVLWDINDTCQLDSGETRVHFKLNMSRLSGQVKKMCPENIEIEYLLTIGSTLTLELTTLNDSAEIITISEALHTYFNVGDVTKTSVTGLHGKEYLDKPDDFKRKKQSGDISISGEVDRLYINTQDGILIDNMKRKIIINKQGSKSTIIWNPWKQVAEKMADMGNNGYLNMLCVESANAAENKVSIAAGQSHTLKAVYSLQYKL